jgi:ribonuclease HII
VILRGDPGAMSLAALRAALAAGAEPSLQFARRLGADQRGGARSLALACERRVEARRRQDLLLRLERGLWASGLRHVAGVDEAGMGPLAGPVVAAAVILDPEDPPPADDSKQLSAEQREELLAEILDRAVAVSVGIAEVEEIAAEDIYRCGLFAMRRAVMGLVPAPEHVLVDARRIPDLPMPQEAHVRGDATSRSIAAASIVAKVRRDAIMAELALRHPGYGFERHAGYATPEHLEALRRLGPCAAHRRSWDALADHSGARAPPVYELRDALRACGTGSEHEGWRMQAQRRLADLSADEVRRLDELSRRHARRLAPPEGDAPALPLS